MKILVAASSPVDAGQGITSYTRTLAVSLRAAGHEVHYAAPPHSDGSFFELHNIKPFPTEPYGDTFENARSLLNYVREQNIEGCINNDNPVLQNIAPALTVPLVAICHMDRRIVARLCTLHSEWIDHLVCISNDMLHTMVRRYSFPLTQCRLIHNGTFDPGHDGEFAPRHPDELRIVCTGGWSKHKGGRRVMKSVIEYPDAWKRVRVDWFGGAVPADVQQKVAHLPGIRFHGKVPQEEFHAVLGEADALVFASNKEGCPMTVLEAMSWGVLPIATNGVGAMRWLIDSGREGFICPLEDYSRQLAHCIRYLADRPKSVEAMKRAARARFLADFQASQNAERIVDLLVQPSVDRSTPAQRFDLCHWHRPMGTPEKPRTWMDKIRYRTGWLDMAGAFDAN